MNLHSMASAAIGTVNPFITATYRKSIGYADTDSGRQIPAYAPDVPLSIQVQALNDRDLKQIQFLSLEGVFRAVYLNGNAQGVVRVDQKGGDLFLFPRERGGPVRTWLVTGVPETWADWSHVIVCLQQDAGT